MPPASCGNVHGKHPPPILCKEAVAVLPFHVVSSHPPPGKCDVIFPRSRRAASWSCPRLAECSPSAVLAAPCRADKAGAPAPTHVATVPAPPVPASYQPPKRPVPRLELLPFAPSSETVTSFTYLERDRGKKSKGETEGKEEGRNYRKNGGKEEGKKRGRAETNQWRRQGPRPGGWHA